MMNANQVRNQIMRRRVAKAKHQMVQTETEIALRLISLGLNARVDRSVARSLLLSSPVFWNGKSIAVKGRSVGCGVWEMSIDKEPK